MGPYVNPPISLGSEVNDKQFTSRVLHDLKKLSLDLRTEISQFYPMN